MPGRGLRPARRGPDHGPARRKQGPGFLAIPGLRDWVTRWWAGGAGATGAILSLLTLPLEFGFRRVSGFWGRLYDGGALPLQRAPIPVISVGNLTVGGTGKTPFSAWLVRKLKEQGESPALVARGYGEEEMVLHRRWNPGTLVVSEEDRAYGVWKAARKGATVAVLDDGFQHRRLARELDIVLVSASTPWRERLLPRGPFREPFSALERAGVVGLTQKGQRPSTSELESWLEPHLRERPLRIAFLPDRWTTLEGKPTEAPDGSYLAIAGIGDPHSFSDLLEELLGRPGELLAFPDHHGYGWPDIQTIQMRAGGRELVTTEKDAVKLHAFARELGEVKVLRLRVEVLEGEERLWHHVQGALQQGRPRR